MARSRRRRRQPSRSELGVRAHARRAFARRPSRSSRNAAIRFHAGALNAGERVATRGILTLLAELAAADKVTSCAMLERLIRAALQQRLLVFLGAICLAAWGANAYFKLPIDAFPDVAPVQVLVAMRAPGLTPEELESRVTAPIEIAARGIPNLVRMRSTTRYSVAADDLRIRGRRQTSTGRARRSTSGCRRSQNQIAGRRRRRPRADRHAARRDADVHHRRRRSHADRAAHAASTGRSVRRSAACPASPTSTCSAASCAPSKSCPRRPPWRRAASPSPCSRRRLSGNNKNDGAGRVRDGEEALLVRAEGRLRIARRHHDPSSSPRGTTGIVRVGDVAEVRNRRLAAQRRRRRATARARRCGGSCSAFAAPTRAWSSMA